MEALRSLAITLLFGAAVAAWLAAMLLPVRKARRSLLRLAGDVCFVLGALLGVLHDHGDPWGIFNAAFGTVLAIQDYRTWRKHRDDDDDWGKRLKSWAKSHIPKPSIVALRPTGSPA